MTNEFIEKAKECKSAEELVALVKENGVGIVIKEADEKLAPIDGAEVSDDELDGVAGGVIVRKNFFYKYYVYDEKTGKILGSFASRSAAEDAAIVAGVDKRKITFERFEELYGYDICEEYERAQKSASD